MIIGHLIYYNPFIIVYKTFYNPFKSSTYIFQASPSFRKKKQQRCQAFSHLRRENETQVYLPKVRADHGEV